MMTRDQVLANLRRVRRDFEVEPFDHEAAAKARMSIEGRRIIEEGTAAKVAANKPKLDALAIAIGIVSTCSEEAFEKIAGET